MLKYFRVRTKQGTSVVYLLTLAVCRFRFLVVCDNSNSRSPRIWVLSQPEIFQGSFVKFYHPVWWWSAAAALILSPSTAWGRITLPCARSSQVSTAHPPLPSSSKHPKIFPSRINKFLLFSTTFASNLVLPFLFLFLQPSEELHPSFQIRHRKIEMTLASKVSPSLIVPKEIFQDYQLQFEQGTWSDKSFFTNFSLALSYKDCNISHIQALKSNKENWISSYALTFSYKFILLLYSHSLYFKKYSWNETWTAFIFSFVIIYISP